MSVIKWVDLDDIRTDPEFARQIPPLTDAEFEQLKQNIRDYGEVRDGLVVWDQPETFLLLDGHNRLRIARELEIDKIPICPVKLSSREEAADWIDRNQLGRRNLTPDQMKLLLGRRYNRAKADPHSRPGNAGNTRGNHPGCQNDTRDPDRNRTRERLAKEHGVGGHTVVRAGKFAAAVDELKSVDPEIEQKVVSGKGPTMQAVVQAAEQLKKDGPEAAKEVLTKPAAKKTPKIETTVHEAQKGPRILKRRPADERMGRAISELESVVFVLAEIESNDVNGQAQEFASRIGKAVTILRGIKNKLEAKQ